MRAHLDGSLHIVAEFPTLTAAEASGIDADGILVASPDFHARDDDPAAAEPLTHREVLETIARALNRRPLFLPFPLWLARLAAPLGGAAFRDRIRRLGEDRASDISQARVLLDFQPRSFEEGLRAMLTNDLIIDH